MMEKLDIIVAQRVQPFLFYKHVTTRSPKEYLSFKVDEGFIYVLRHVFCKFTKTEQSRPGGNYYNAELKTEFFNESKSMARQVDPIPVNLYTTPGSERVITITAPDAFRKVDSAVPLKNRMTLNYSYQGGSTIMVEVTGQEDNGLGEWIPQYWHIVLSGYYIPDKDFFNWKG